VKSQERNTAQLVNIGAAMEWKWGLEIENEKKESKDDEERSKDGPEESQERRILLFTSC